MPRSQVPQGLHIKSTNSTFRPYGTVDTRLGLRFLPTFRPYGTMVACIQVLGRTLNQKNGAKIKKIRHKFDLLVAKYRKNAKNS
ncbi:MAG: hypothetical protein LBD59_02205 [Prevotellaceae bacterium]|nr:hypothetical protein [Prevotellaceae bacterium]